MNKWRGNYTGRPLIEHNGEWSTFVSEHPLEERTITLTDEYRDENGDFIPPEPIEWDGVETCPGIMIGPDDEG